MPFHEAPDKQIISSFCRLGKQEIITGNKLTNKTSLSPPCRTISSPMISVALGATLSWQREGDLLAAGLPNNDLLLVNGVGGIDKLGNVEALVLNLVLALDLSDGDVLGDADLLGGRVGKAALDSEGSSDKGNLVGLGLVLLMADLVLTMVGVGSVAVGRGLDSTSGDLHGLRLLVIGDLGGLAVSDNIFPLVDIGADLPLDNSVGLLADGEDTVEAVVVVNNLLDCQGDWGHLLGKGRHADLSVNRCVGVPAKKLRSMVVSMMYSMVSMWEEGSFSSHQAEEYESLKMIKLHQGVLLRHMCNGNRSVGALWALTSGPPAWTPDPPDQVVTGPPTRQTLARILDLEMSREN